MNIDKIIASIDVEKDYTSKELSEMIGVTTAAMNGVARRGVLPVRKIFNKYYFKGLDIKRYLTNDKSSTEK